MRKFLAALVAAFLFLAMSPSQCPKCDFVPDLTWGWPLDRKHYAALDLEGGDSYGKRIRMQQELLKRLRGGPEWYPVPTRF